MNRTAIGGIYTGYCPDCKVKSSMVFSPGLGRCICTSCNYTPTLIILNNKVMAMEESERRIGNVNNINY